MVYIGFRVSEGLQGSRVQDSWFRVYRLVRVGLSYS